MKIFAFTWNTQSVIFSEHCKFITELAEFIKTSNPDLIIIALQEDNIPSSNIIEFIYKRLAGWDLIHKSELSGWGTTTYENLRDDWVYYPRGLRLAVFKRQDSLDGFQVNSVAGFEFVCPGFQNYITSGKGCIVANLLTSLGVITIMNTHLPFSSSSLIPDPKDPTKRNRAVLWQALCLQYLYDSTRKTCFPDYLIVMGDLNFRVQVRTENGAKEIVNKIFETENNMDTNAKKSFNIDYIHELIKEADEIRLLTSYAKLPVFREGINNAGPVFIPTCKLKKDRILINKSMFNTGSKNQRTPSWCDRILVESLQQDKECKYIEYDRWEQSEMKKSDHAGVYAVLII